MQLIISQSTAWQHLRSDHLKKRKCLNGTGGAKLLDTAFPLRLPPLASHEESNLHGDPPALSEQPPPEATSWRAKLLMVTPSAMVPAGSGESRGLLSDYFPQRRAPAACSRSRSPKPMSVPCTPSTCDARPSSAPELSAPVHEKVPARRRDPHAPVPTLDLDDTDDEGTDEDAPARRKSAVVSQRLQLEAARLAG